MHREHRERKFPSPSLSTPAFNESKMATLAYFAVTPGWHPQAQVKNDRLASDLERLIPRSKSVPMRLLRYTKQGLLMRRRGRRGYEYTITRRGEEWLLHLWRSKGLLDPDKAETEDEMKAVYIRLRLERVLLERYNLELHKPRAMW